MVTLKIKSRSPESNQLFTVPQENNSLVLMIMHGKEASWDQHQKQYGWGDINYFADFIKCFQILYNCTLI